MKYLGKDVFSIKCCESILIMMILETDNGNEDIGYYRRFYYCRSLHHYSNRHSIKPMLQIVKRKFNFALQQQYLTFMPLFFISVDNVNVLHYLSVKILSSRADDVIIFSRLCVFKKTMLRNGCSYSFVKTKKKTGKH